MDPKVGNGTEEPLDSAPKNDDAGGLPAGVVEKPVREEGGGPKGVVDGCAVRLDRREGPGVEGGLEEPGTRKLIAAQVSLSWRGVGQWLR